MKRNKFKPNKPKHLQPEPAPARIIWAPVAETHVERQLRRINRKLNFLLLYLPEVIATKQDIRNIMSAISEYTSVVQAQYARINAGLDNVTSDLAGVKAKLEQMNNNPGPITQEDQALLNDSIAALTAIGDRTEALAASTEDVPTPPAA